MSILKQKAVRVLMHLLKYGKIDCSDYSIILDALDEIEPLADRDKQIENLWESLEDVPVNPETEQLEDKFMKFPVGTDKEEIWHWFDERHSKGVHYLLYEKE